MLTLDLPTFLEQASAPTAGRFGEELFYSVVKETNLDISKKHAKGVDFEVEVLGSVDVKVVRSLDSAIGDDFRRTPKGHRIANVNYAYIIFRKGSCELVIESDFQVSKQLNQVIHEDLVDVTWGKFDKSKIKLKNRNSDSIKKAVKVDLVTWIEENWGQSAKVIQRGDKARNDAMIRRGWGADNFFCDADRCDLVVLLNFNEGQVYKVYAYPISHRSEINWYPKKVGTNVQNITCWDPGKIDSKFIFNSIEDLKQEFNKRFS